MVGAAPATTERNSVCIDRYVQNEQCLKHMQWQTLSYNSCQRKTVGIERDRLMLLLAQSHNDNTTVSFSPICTGPAK